MGVGLNTMLAAVGAAGVAESKIGTAISEANDADKAEAMKQKALMNAQKLKGQKLWNKNMRLQNRKLTLEINQMKGGKK